MMVVIGFCGEKNSGKSTAAQVLEKNFGFTPIALADPLKEMLSKVFRLSLEYFTDTNLKDKDFGYDVVIDYHHIDKIRDIIENEWNFSITPEQREQLEEYHGLDVKSPRELMQLVGTDMVRDIINKDVFIRLLAERIMHMETPVVITDIRFKNERQSLKKMGVVLCRVKRTIKSDDNHISETDLGSDDEYDALFYNDEDVNSFISAVSLWLTMRKDSIIIYNQFKINDSPYSEEN